ATAALERSSEPDVVRWAQLELVTSLMHQRLHAFPEAIASARLAREHARGLDPAPMWLLISTETRIGSAMQADGDSEGSRAHLERALAWQLELKGEQHPATANILFELASLHIVNLHEIDEGISLAKRVVEILDRPDYGPTVAAAEAHEILAYTYLSLQRTDDARQSMQRTVELHDALYPREHSRQLSTYTLRSNLAQAEGRPEEAWAWAEEGLLLANRTLGGSAPLTGSMSATAGQLALLQEKFEIAEQHFESAREIFEEVTGPDHPIMVEILTSLGNARFGLGKAEDARDCYRRALEIAGPGPARARPLIGLAHASDTPADTIRYAELAREAEPGYASEVAALLKNTRR
ncbi:MAG: tetratricopeptide repeat protein, partial [Nannocystaceae bacterium]|nr:tetratricopeptide repeat protein [Nannocystaceae bacterium]